MSEQMEPARLDELMILAPGGGWLRSGEANELLAHVDAQAASIQRVREIHGPDNFMGIPGADCCSEYQTPGYPCPTIQALDGGQE